jgi:hypothetical protein
LRAIDTRNPGLPVEVGYYNTDALSYEVVATGRTLFLADGFGGVYILRSEVPVPIYLPSFNAVRVDGQAVLSWEVAYTSNHPGFFVWRAEPGEPRERISPLLIPEENGQSFVDTAPPAGEVDYWLQESFPDGREQWFGPARLAAADPVPAALSLSAGFPNPFNPQTRFTFSVPVSGRVELAVYNLAGRKVALLVEGFLPAGTHEAVWDGHDDSGVAVASGVYVVRLVTDHGVRANKITLAR